MSKIKKQRFAFPSKEKAIEFYVLNVEKFLNEGCSLKNRDRINEKTVSTIFSDRIIRVGPLDDFPRWKVKIEYYFHDAIECNVFAALRGDILELDKVFTNMRNCGDSYYEIHILPILEKLVVEKEE
jgi:hypothetical protein